MTYSDGFNLRSTSVRFNDIADAIDGVLKRGYVATTTGTSTAYIATPTPAWTSYADAPVIVIVPHVTNTLGSPSVTINISGLGAIAIKRAGVDIEAGAIIANAPIILAYNGVNFEILLSEDALRKDGSNSATGNLNIGGYRITNLGAATVGTDAIRLGQVQDGAYAWLGTTAGTATAQTASASPAITSYVAGQKFRMLVGTGLSSTGVSPTAHTININGIGAKQIVSNDGLNSSPTNGSWVEGALLELVYDGTYMRIINNPSAWQAYTVTTGNFTGVAPNVVSAINTLEVSRYIKIGKIVVWELGINFNLGTGGGQLLNITPPVAASASIAASNCFFAGTYAADSAAGTFPVFYFTSATTLRISRNALLAQNWLAAATCYVRGVITYEGA